MGCGPSRRPACPGPLSYRSLPVSGSAPRSYAGCMLARRRRGYFWMMGGCILLFVSAWGFVRLWSIPVAVGMCVVAMVIPPIAAMVANRRGPDDRWWDDPSGDPKSDEWWDELDGKKRRP
ncbi:DUF3099 domain-containing protein [Streptomyces sp. NPDC059095]|uniref:DUF3099 domain-containing protein n=1 Tax=unclassified Streptomyces TaxID=2593676 RepID=UPI001D4974F7|nr:DUF3099 domain-containing protein [Streptomyces sp. MAG02]